MEEIFSKDIDPRLTKSVEIRVIEDQIKERQELDRRFLELKQMHISKCNVCGNADQSNISFQTNGFTFIKCPECTHVYKQYIPEFEELKKFYREETVEGYFDESSIEYRLENITKPKIDFMMRYQTGENGRWLDLATGLGDLPHLLKNAGWDIDATELHRPYIDYATKRFGITPKQKPLLEYYNYYKEQGLEEFDVISGFGFYDMSPIPVENCKVVNRMLKIGGLHGVNLPNSNSLTGALVESWPNSALRQSLPNTICSFTYKSMVMMLETSGFEISGVLWHGLDIHELITRIVELDPNFKNSRGYSFLYDNINAFQQVVDKARMSDLILICARKVREV